MQTKIIQLSAASASLESSFVVAKVLKFFIKDLKNNDINYTLLNSTKGSEPNSLLDATLLIKGDWLDTFLKNWIGQILWTTKSTKSKQKSWWINLQELDIEFKTTISANEINYQTMRSQGAGGQHVNKVSSAVRATHIPTGIQVVVMDSRSQHQNKKIATQRLIEKVNEHQLQELKTSLKSIDSLKTITSNKSPIKTFVGTDFKKKKENPTFKKTRNSLKKDLRDNLNE